MIGRISLSFPYLYTFAGLSWYRNRQAGFSFTNRATLILSENIGKSIDEIPKWVDENRTLYLSEMLYAAYLANCQETYTRPKFSKGKLLQGYLKLSEEDQRRIIKTWNDSLTAGHKEMPGKKKVR